MKEHELGSVMAGHLEHDSPILARYRVSFSALPARFVKQAQCECSAVHRLTRADQLQFDPGHSSEHQCSHGSS